MSNLVRVREYKTPEFLVGATGKQQLRGGRWNNKAIADWLIANPSWQSMDDIARAIYGTTTKSNRVKVRKHIPSQRKYMLNDLEQPIVTQYGERGRITKIKIFNPTDENDKMLLRMELDRARERKEVSEHRYNSLVHIFLLTSPPELPPSIV